MVWHHRTWCDVSCGAGSLCILYQRCNIGVGFPSHTSLILSYFPTIYCAQAQTQLGHLCSTDFSGGASKEPLNIQEM